MTENIGYFIIIKLSDGEISFLYGSVSTIVTSSCSKDINKEKIEEDRDETEITEEMRETYAIKSILNYL